MSELWAGTVAPDFIDLLVTSPAGGLNLTTVSAATIIVYFEGGTTATWTATLVGASATSLTLRHSFSASPSEVPLPGRMVMYGHMTVPGGFVDTPRAERLIRATREVP